MNNRQAGRRRGRGGQRSQGGSPNQGNGNRIDNRARGNAAQLLEKYKNLARDAQMQGDRVNAEYYLQFADHYFRVLSESRSRFEEQQGHRRDRDHIDDDDDGYEAEAAEPREERREERRDYRNGHASGHAGGHANGGEQAREAREEAEAPREEREQAPRRRGRPRKSEAPAEQASAEADEASAADEGIASRLPPAFGEEYGLEGEPVAQAAPRRRGRPRKSEEAPAA